MSIKGILFDKDGTLIAFDNVWGPLYRKILVEDFGYSDDAALALLVTTGFEPETGTCRAGSAMAAATLDQITAIWWPELAEAERKARAALIVKKIDKDANGVVQPLLALAPVFDQLHAMGLVLGVGTNDTEGSAIAHMREIDVHHYFDAMIGADSVASPKPSGHMVKRFAEVAGLAPHEIAMVGDNSHDIAEARAGGAGLAIGVLSGNSTREDLAHLADHVIADVGGLPGLLRDIAHVL